MAWFNPDTGRAEVLRNAEGHDETPSLIYLGEDEVLVGESARDALDLPEQSAGVILSVKSDLRRKIRYPVPGRPAPVDVAAHILRKMRRDAEEGHFRAEVTRAAITCPASFDAVERDLLMEAARKAGFTDVVLLDEPVSAAMAYAHAGYRVGSHVLVYDLGAGTFDAALLVREVDGTYRLGLPPAGLRCGGDDFDRALYDHCDALAQEQFGHSLGHDGNLDLRFLFECRKRKENLTIRDRCHFSSWIQGPDGVSKQFRHQVERTVFEDLIAPTLEPTVRLIRTLLEQAAHQNIAVETVILVGGSSRVPLAAHLLRETLPVEPQRWEKQDIAVALGAALFAHAHFSEAPAKIVPHSETVPVTPVPAVGTSSTVSARSVAACLRDGEEAMKKGDFTTALHDFEEAHRSAPTDPHSLTGIGQASLGLGDTMGAVLALQKAVRLDPTTHGPVRLLAETQLRGGLAAQAVATLEPLAQTTQDAGFHVLFGSALGTAGRHADALDQFLFGAILDPSAEDAFAALVSLLAQPGPRTQAIAQIVQVPEAQLSPHQRLSLGFALVAARDFPNAVRHFHQAASARYGLSLAQYGLGEAAAAAGKAGVAVAHFGSAYEQDIRNRRALFRAGCVAAEACLNELSASQFTRLIAAESDYPQAHFKLGQVFLALRDYDRAAAELHEATRQKPDTPGIAELLAVVAERRTAETVIAEVPARWHGQSGTLTVTRVRLWFAPTDRPRAGEDSNSGLGKRFTQMAKTAYRAVQEVMNKGVELPVGRILRILPWHAPAGQGETLLISMIQGGHHVFEIGPGRDEFLRVLQAHLPFEKFETGAAPSNVPLNMAQSEKEVADDA